ASAIGTLATRPMRIEQSAAVRAVAARADSSGMPAAWRMSGFANNVGHRQKRGECPAQFAERRRVPGVEREERLQQPGHGAREYHMAPDVNSMPLAYRY